MQLRNSETCDEPPGSSTITRAAFYLRCSTSRQVETELSIPSQRTGLSQWCDSRNAACVAEFIEPGDSATDDKRAVFQQMIERACDGSNPFNVILVYSYSRFFRDSFGCEFYLRRLAKHGVRVISITQELTDDDPAQSMMRRIINLFDEYQSAENGRSVLKAMKLSAQQGYWTGSKPPFGYKTIEVERKGARIKKRLDIDAVEAEDVRLFFKLLLQGDGKSGPMGVKAICCWLNERGYRTRSGGRWGIGPMYAILTRPLYAGRMQFNVHDSKTKRKKSSKEIVEAEVPAIISLELSEQAIAFLKSRNPRVASPRVVSGPILLTGLATCASCGGAMTLRTGTSKTGRVYKYYTCSATMRSGKSDQCQGRSFPMERLDKLVCENLVDRLLTSERVHDLLVGLKAGREERNASVDARLMDLQRDATAAEDKLKRLYAAIANGVADLEDPTLKLEVTRHKGDRDRALAALERAKATAAQPILIDPALVARFTTIMRENVVNGDVPFRKAYIGSVVDRVEVDDDQIRIVGSAELLETAVLAGGVPRLGVQRRVLKWRARRDSNS